MRPHFTPHAYWRNQLAVTVASFMGFTGFTLVMPFLPLYFQQLGVLDLGEIALWSGLSLGVTPALTAAVAPLWGRVGDRVGKKLMVERSLVSFVIVMAAMAYVTQAWHIVALRAVQGLFAGYGALTVTMAAESAPRERLAAAIGMVQTAQRLGPALGPVIGGALAELVGLRRAFLVAAVFYAVALAVVVGLYREPRPDRLSTEDGPSGQWPLRRVLAFENFVLLMGVVFLLQLVDRSFGPILPLYVAGIGVALERVPLTAGVLFSLVAASGAAGNLTCGPLLRRVAPRRVIAASGILGALAAVAFAAAGSLAAVGLAAVVFGFALGTASTAAYAAAGAVMPPGTQGAGFGVLTSAALVGVALSPVVSGVLATAAIRLVFLLDAILLLLLAGLVSRVMVGPGAKVRVPLVDEA